ncbi:MAG: DUF1501 domain-containing protein [Planctomycetes bacterium]|nr:DUF1501 domain-containing protein [Planctomycetota bacterium]
MRLTRRTFMRRMGAASILSLGASPPRFLTQAARAAEADGRATDGRILVVIQLAGGNDGLNTVIPFGDPEYRRARPGIGIAKGSVLRIDDYLGLHPQMKGLKGLYDEGVLGIVQGVGYPNPNRSHFRSMDIWQTARPESERTETGWLGRCLDLNAERHAGTVPALALGTDQVPLSLVSSKFNVPTLRRMSDYELQLGPGSQADRQARRALMSQLATGESVPGSDLDYLRRTTAGALAMSDRLKEVAATYQPTTSYPANGLGQRLKAVVQLIAAELGTRIFFLSLGGFDTHSQQVAAHRALLAEFSSAVAAFTRDLEGHGLQDRVLLVSFSEFGRRVQENGSLGTDHGAASQMFVVSPTAKGGLYGAHPSLTDLSQGDLKYHTDFRSVYATILDNWLGVTSQTVLGGKFPTIDFV